jgi:hypothetical protein
LCDFFFSFTRFVLVFFCEQYDQTPAKQRNAGMKKMHYHLLKAAAYAMRELASDRKYLASLMRHVTVNEGKRRVTVNGDLKKQAKKSKSAVAPGNQAHYSVFGPSVSSSGFRLSFTAKATNDIHVAFLGKRVQRSKSAVEVVIGGFGDQQSMIRQGTQGSEVVSNTQAGRARAAAIVGYEIVYQDGFLTVSPQGGEPFLSAPVTMPKGARLQVGLGGWDSPVAFTNVRASTWPVATQAPQVNPVRVKKAAAVTAAQVCLFSWLCCVCQFSACL